MAPVSRKRGPEGSPSPRPKPGRKHSRRSSQVTTPSFIEPVEDDEEDILVSASQSLLETSNVLVSPIPARATTPTVSCSTTAVSPGFIEPTLQPRRSNRAATAARTPIKRNRNLSPSDDSSDEDNDLSYSQDVSQKKKRKSNSNPRVYSGQPLPKPIASLTNKLRAEEMERQRAFTGSHSGVLKSLRLYNFMCHDNFFQTWHPNLNFITGENGSGKSALLSGMLVGLGAKATTTSRTRSTSSLIMKGKDSARTIVVLLNYGALPVTKYGKEISIERTLTKNGSSQYKVKADAHKWRQLRRNELDYILLSLNIQLDNPVAILNQETAKNFLRTKDPKDKYTLFYQGTLLAKLFGLLSESRVDIDASQNNLEFHKNIICELKNEVGKLEKKMNEFSELQKLTDGIGQLQIEYLWALVHDEEQRKLNLNEKLGKLEKETIGFGAKIIELEEKKKQTQEDKTPTANLQSIKQKVNEKERRMDAIRKERNELSKKSTELKARGRTSNSDIVNKKTEIATVETMLMEMQTISEEDEERAKLLFEEKKIELEGKKSTTQQKMMTLKQDSEQFKNGADVAKEELTLLEDKHALLIKEIESKRKTIKAMESPNANKYAVYGHKMEVLMGKIQANMRKFSKPPRGPMGSYLTVKNKKYAALIEVILKGFLDSFVVSSAQDMILLKQLMKEVYDGGNSRNSYGGGGGGLGSAPRIQQNPFANKVHDFSKGIARISSASTVFDLLEIENNDHIAINALIDYCDAEKILLFDTNKAAAEVMKDENKVPKTCIRAFTLEMYRFIPTPRYSANALPIRRPDNILSVSKKQQITSLKADVESLQHQIDQLRPSLELKKREEATLSKESVRRLAEIEKHRKVLHAFDKDLRDLIRTNESVSQDLASHQEELKTLEAQLAVLEENKSKQQAALAELKPKFDALEQEKRELEEQIPKLLNSILSVEDIKEKNAKAIEQFNTFLERVRTKLAAVKNEKTPIQAQLKNCEKELDRKIATAQESGERVSTNRTSAAVKQDFETIKMKKKELEKYLGNSNKFKELLENKKTELGEKLKEYIPIYKSFQILRDLIESQLLFLFKKRAEISNGLSLTYTSLASQRGYKGQMLIDHDKKELYFFICPDKSSSSRTDDVLATQPGMEKQSKKTLIEYSLGLSGGERSFSTICFIMSLWQVMECPFYMLDEFDVFMDALNRKASQQALISHAKRFKKHQFFLFSPLDLFEVPQKEEATTLRLRPARPELTVGAPPASPAASEIENLDPSSTVEVPAGKSKATSSRRKVGAMAEKNKTSSR